MIVPDSPFRAAPRISRAAFARVIYDHANPGLVAERDPGAYWDAIAATGIDPCLVLAIFRHESTFGRFGVARQTRSWGNTRNPSFGATPLGEVPGASGVFPVFRDWLDGAKSTAARLASPEWVYSGPSTHPKSGQVFPGRTTIREIFDHPSTRVWAPAGDFNDPDGYLREVIDYMNSVSDQEGPMGVAKPPMLTDLRATKYDGYSTPRRVEAICRHISNGREQGDLQQLTQVVSSNYYINRAGVIRELVPPDHSAWTNGDVQSPDVSNPLIAAWVSGGINPNTRTLTIEHEGMTTNGRGSALTEAQWESTIRLGAWLSQEYGLPADRVHNIGHYQINSVGRSYCPGFSAAEWERLVSGMAALLAGPAPADPNARQFDTGLWVVNQVIDGEDVPMLRAWETLGGMVVLGNPVSGMEKRESDGTYVQVFDNGMIEIRNGAWRLGGLGQRYIELRALLGDDAPPLGEAA